MVWLQEVDIQRVSLRRYYVLMVITTMVAHVVDAASTHIAMVESVWALALSVSPRLDLRQVCQERCNALRIRRRHAEQVQGKCCGVTMDAIHVRLDIQMMAIVCFAISQI